MQHSGWNQPKHLSHFIYNWSGFKGLWHTQLFFQSLNLGTNNWVLLSYLALLKYIKSVNSLFSFNSSYCSYVYTFNFVIIDSMYIISLWFVGNNSYSLIES